jgi:hypothetical protein
MRSTEYCEMMQAPELGIPQQSKRDPPFADDIRINDPGSN